LEKGGDWVKHGRKRRKALFVTVKRKDFFQGEGGRKNDPEKGGEKKKTCLSISIKKEKARESSEWRKAKKVVQT